jgi:hypothetical protein
MIKGATPPDGVTCAEPVHAPKQDSGTTFKLAWMGGGAPIVNALVTLHPFTSVTVTCHAPMHNPLTAFVP